jgi:hypothetical protein
MIRRVSGEEPGPEVQGTTVNIAPSGLLIEAADTDAVTGDVVGFHLYLPDNHDKTRLRRGHRGPPRHRNDLCGAGGPDLLAAVRGYHRAVRLRPFLDFAGGRL